MPNINLEFVVNIIYCLKKAEFPPHTSMQLTVITSSTRACCFHEDNQVSKLSPQTQQGRETATLLLSNLLLGNYDSQGHRKILNHRKINIKTPNAFMENSIPRLTKDYLELYSPPAQQIHT